MKVLDSKKPLSVIGNDVTAVLIAASSCVFLYGAISSPKNDDAYYTGALVLWSGITVTLVAILTFIWTIFAVYIHKKHKIHRRHIWMWMGSMMSFFLSVFWVGHIYFENMVRGWSASLTESLMLCILLFVFGVWGAMRAVVRKSEAPSAA